MGQTFALGVEKIPIGRDIEIFGSLSFSVKSKYISRRVCANKKSKN